MTKKKTPEPEADTGEKKIARPSGRTPGSARDKRAKKRDAKLSKTGVNARTGKPKPLNIPDSVTPEPVAADTTVTVNHVMRGLELGLTAKEIEFVNTYIGNGNGTRSYMAVYPGCSYATANARASVMLSRPHVRTYLAERMTAALARAEAAQDRLVQSLTYVAFGDVNELIEHRREACRYCHGKGFRYQCTPAERENRFLKYLEGAEEIKKKGGAVPPFDELGGVGFDPRKDPHPDCPECFGEGREKVHIHDTRTLSPSAAALYEGVEMTKDGIKVKIANKDGARDKLAKIAKLYEDQKTEVNVTLGSDELEKLFRARMESAQRRAEEMRTERGLSKEG